MVSCSLVGTRVGLLDLYPNKENTCVLIHFTEFHQKMVYRSTAVCG
jgi:hypothetical protein